MGIVISRPKRRVFDARIGRIQGWVARRLGGTRHEQRVMQIAGGIFDLTARHHRLRKDHRRLLRLAALLHDVGRARGRSDHHVTGARMVLDSPTLDLRDHERPAIAHLTTFHRGRIPRADRDWLLHRQVSPRSMQLLLAILRAADALDSRRFATPALALELDGNRLRIRCYVPDVRRAEKVFARRKKFRLLEKLLGLQITVQCVPHTDLE